MSKQINKNRVESTYGMTSVRLMMMVPINEAGLDSYTPIDRCEVQNMKMKYPIVSSIMTTADK